MSLNISDKIKIYKINDIIKYSWTILSLSIAIFVVKYVVINKMLTNKERKLEKPNNYDNFIEDVKANEKYVENINLEIFSIVLLLVNSLLNIIVLGVNFCIETNELLLKFLSTLGFYFSTNTFCCFIVNICSPILKEKIQFNRENKIKKYINIMSEFYDYKNIDKNKNINQLTIYVNYYKNYYHKLINNNLNKNDNDDFIIKSDEVENYIDNLLNRKEEDNSINEKECNDLIVQLLNVLKK